MAGVGRVGLDPIGNLSWNLSFTPHRSILGSPFIMADSILIRYSNYAPHRAMTSVVAGAPSPPPPPSSLDWTVTSWAMSLSMLMDCK